MTSFSAATEEQLDVSEEKFLTLFMPRKGGGGVIIAL